MTTDMKWTAQAACTGHGELFFEDNRPTVVRKAKAFCRDCVVRRDCLNHAIENNEVGLWGGMTANERRIYKSLQNRGIDVA